MRNRILSILLVLALCLAYMPVQVHAAEVTEITITGLTSKYRAGDLISVDLGGIYAAGNGEGAVMTDDKQLVIDGTTYYYPWDTSLTWETGSEYTLILPLATDTDELSSNVVCTVDGETVTLSNIGSNGATLNYRIYAATDASAATEPTAKTGLTYNGSNQALLNAGSTNDGTMQYKLASATEWSSTIPTAKNSGTYEILWRIQGDDSHFDYEEPTPLMVTIDACTDDIVATPKNQTIAVNDDLPTNSYTVTGLKGSDTLEGTAVYTYTDGTNTVADPREEGPGTYQIVLSGLSIPTDIENNYAATSVTFETGTLTVEEEDFSYDFEQPSSGIGAGKTNKNAWTWGERANLPVEVADFYKVLVENSVPAGEATPAIPGGKSGHSISNFLAKDNTWGLPAADPAGPTYKVDEALVCEDYEPDYFANGDGKVDESTFGKSDFYVVGVGTGDTKIDYPKLTTGDVVSNTKFNGVYITKLQKSGNATYDADLAKLKSDCIASFRAFELDHPEVFWLTGSIKLRVLTVTISGVQTSYIFMTLVDDGGFSMRISEYAAAGAIETAIGQRDAAVNAILAQIPAEATVRQKIANLNKWFTLHNEYNRSTDLNSIGYTPHRALKSLVGNEGANGPVCDGYSRGFKVICDKLGIPVVLDTGMASIGSHSELHMWMRVQVDGTWYGMDCTWDDPIVSGKNGKISGYENEKYMLVGDDTVVDGKKFSVSHPSNKTAGGTTGVLFAGLEVNPKEIDDYLVLPFTDVRLADWFFDYVKAANSKKIVGGMTATTYGPAGQLTHAQIMVMVANLHSRQKGDNFTSTPVSGDHWAASFRDYLKKEGVIDDRFDAVLDKPVTRGEMSYYFANTLTKSSYKNKQTISLSDIADIPYKAEIERLAKANIVGGFPDGTFRADELVTRSQASVFVSNILEAIGK